MCSKVPMARTTYKWVGKGKELRTMLFLFSPATAPVLVSGLDIEMLSEKLGRDYARLGPRLGISSAEMEYLELDCSRTSYQHVTRNMLQKWCKSVGPDATRVNLSEKLRAIQRVDLATELLQL